MPSLDVRRLGLALSATYATLVVALVVSAITACEERDPPDRQGAFGRPGDEDAGAQKGPEHSRTLSKAEASLVPPDESQEMSTSSQSHNSIREESTVAGASWVVSHANNPRGTFVLVRNTNPPSESGPVLQVSLNGQEAEILSPRETAIRDCDVIDRDGADLSLRTAKGAILYRAKVVCGDAVYAKSKQPSG